MPIPPHFQADTTLAWDVLGRAPVVHLAGVGSSGEPVLRTVHAAVSNGRLLVHGGDHGGKLALIGAPVVATAERIVARIPSTFIDPTIACPATTYYESVHAEGTLEPIEGIEDKARALQAFMDHFQPEGGYTPLSADHPTYGSALRRLLVAQLVPVRLTAKRKLGQNRSEKQIRRIVECLWRRGAPGDLDAIESILSAHPSRTVPALLQGPAETRLVPALGPDGFDEVVDLLRGQYWLEGVSEEAVVRAHRGAVAWVGVRSAAGDVIASARANSDGSRHAYLADVVVHAAWRRRGIGTALVRFLLDHPRLRDVDQVTLATRDATRLYERVGFVERRPRYTVMVRRAAASARGRADSGYGVAW